MRALPLAILGACAHASRPSAPAPTNEVVFEGTVTDQFGKPIAGADVLVCESAAPCDFVKDRAAWSADRLPVLLAAPDLAHIAGSAIATTTDAGGHWRVTLPRAKADKLEMVLTTAPGWTIGGGLHPDKVALFELRPARGFDLQPTCSPSPCPAQMNPQVKQHGHSVVGFLHGTHVDHLPIGQYDVELIANYGMPGEQRGHMTIDTADATSYAIALSPTGSGLAITGTVVGKFDRPITIAVECSDGVRRTVVTDKDGAFRVDDVGKAPCHAEALVAPRDDHETVQSRPAQVDHLPATVQLQVEIGRWDE